MYFMLYLFISFVNNLCYDNSSSIYLCNIADEAIFLKIGDQANRSRFMFFEISYWYCSVVLGFFPIMSSFPWLSWWDVHIDSPFPKIMEKIDLPYEEILTVYIVSFLELIARLDFLGHVNANLGSRSWFKRQVK